MDQQTQPQPPVQQPPAAPAKKSKVWLWILGGCLAIVVITLIVIGALGWWGVKKVKKEIDKAQPKLEQFKEGTEEWQGQSEQWKKDAEEFQKEMEKLQKQVPSSPGETGNEAEPE
ncbi:MAG: hypothetical protein NT136_03180 [Candidatus Moranbacteria bacterium]|nr:hypothetical protein [Candidatus Moranbacteria bacterium]